MTSRQTFKITLQIQSGEARIKVSGAIDELSDFAPAQAELASAHASGASQLVFDLSEVNQLNSIGIKKWISFLEASRVLFKLRFEKISEMIVAQANVISSMLGPKGTSIAYFAAPYLCETCEKEFSRELKLSDLTDNGDGTVLAPKLVCAACGGALIFDEYEEEYFFFLKHMSAG